MKKNELIQAELDASTFEIAKRENAGAQQSATSDSVACDTINWEQRRWELATSLFAHYPGLTNVSALELADGFIEYYKNPCKTSTLV